MSVVFGLSGRTRCGTRSLRSSRRQLRPWGRRELGRLLPAGEAIFIARHHGLPTRLLDWTASPLYGLYFACLGEIKKPARLWAMCRVRGFGEYALDSLSLSRVENERTLLAQLDGKDPTYERTAAWNREPRRLKILEPPYNSARLLAQDGVFTGHNCPSVDLEAFAGKTFKAADLDISHFFSWSIPARKKVALLGELNALGITHRSVFPDLDGIRAEPLGNRSAMGKWP